MRCLLLSFFALTVAIPISGCANKRAKAVEACFDRLRDQMQITDVASLNNAHKLCEVQIAAGRKPSDVQP